MTREQLKFAVLPWHSLTQTEAWPHPGWLGAQHLKTKVSVNREGQMTVLESFPNGTFHGNKPAVQLKMAFTEALCFIYKDKSIFFLNTKWSALQPFTWKEVHRTTSDYPSAKPFIKSWVWPVNLQTPLCPMSEKRKSGECQPNPMQMQA